MVKFVAILVIAVVFLAAGRSQPTGLPEICKLPAQPGICLAYFQNWHYNSTSGACETFVYGGCGGNENNFESKEECDEKCSEKKRNE